MDMKIIHPIRRELALRQRQEGDSRGIYTHQFVTHRAHPTLLLIEGESGIGGGQRGDMNTTGSVRWSEP